MTTVPVRGILLWQDRVYTQAQANVHLSSPSVSHCDEHHCSVSYSSLQHWLQVVTLKPKSKIIFKVKSERIV